MARKVSKRRKIRTARHHGVDVKLLQRNLPVLSRSMTFAPMVRENAAFISAIKDLRWLFPPVCQRKDQVHIWVGGTMSDASVSPADPVFWLHHGYLKRPCTTITRT